MGNSKPVSSGPHRTESLSEMRGFFRTMEHFTYILYSKSTNAFYKGSTNNLDVRIQRHNAQSEKSTKHGTPWILIWSAEKPSKSEAYKLEMKLKNLTRKRLVLFMLKYNEGFAGPNERKLAEQILVSC
jgi:putative endonuclease